MHISWRQIENPIQSKSTIQSNPKKTRIQSPTSRSLLDFKLFILLRGFYLHKRIIILKLSCSEIVHFQRMIFQLFCASVSYFFRRQLKLSVFFCAFLPPFFLFPSLKLFFLFVVGCIPSHVWWLLIHLQLWSSSFRFHFHSF